MGALVRSLLADPGARAGMEAELAIRRRMTSIADNLDEIRAYLDAADNSLTYQVMAGRVSGDPSAAWVR